MQISPLVIPPGAVKLLPWARVVSPHQHTFHSPRAALIKCGKPFETLVSHPLSLSHAQHGPSSRPASLPHRVCSSSQWQDASRKAPRWNGRWFGFHHHVPSRRANRRRFVRNSVFHSKKQLKTCYVKGFMKRVLKIHIFKASWPLGAAAQASSPMIKHSATYRSATQNLDTWIQNSHTWTDSPPDYAELVTEPTHTADTQWDLDTSCKHGLWIPFNCNKWNQLILLIDIWLKWLSISSLISML